MSNVMKLRPSVPDPEGTTSRLQELVTAADGVDLRDGVLIAIDGNGVIHGFITSESWYSIINLALDVVKARILAQVGQPVGFAEDAE